MDIMTAPCLEGARRAEGVVIVVDVFRAGNTAAALMARGTPFIEPVAELEAARALKAEHPNRLLVGERGGLKPEGFDLDNSPAEAIAMGVTDRPSILTTSAGTQGLTAAASKARVLMMATLVNASAAVRYIHNLKPDLVTIVPIGLAGRERAVEDDVVADFLADRLGYGQPDYRKAAKRMIEGPGTDRLRRLGLWRDLAFCLRLDYLNIVPVAEKRDGRLVLKPIKA